MFKKIGITTLIWLLIAAVFVLASENIIATLMPGHHHVEHWLLLVGAGLGIILLLYLLSLVVIFKTSS